MINVARTREYYRHLTAEDLCQCAYCRNYYQEIRVAYPELTEHLDALGIDIEKPFETMPLEPDEDGNILYVGVQYVVFGTDDGSTEGDIGDVALRIAASHPTNGIKDDHFVIEIDPIRLRWTVNENGE